jgi:ribosome-associated translation inhibitor RaiA
MRSPQEALSGNRYGRPYLLADKLDRRVIKHKEMRADHHAAEARKATRV